MSEQLEPIPKKKANESVLYAQHGAHIGIITLNRVDVHNAINTEMIVALKQHLQACIKTPKIRVILLNANGCHFSSGADLNWMKASANLTLEDNLADAQQLAELLHQLYCCPKPIVIAAQGNAFGGALGLLACGDIVFTHADSQFCFSEVKLGLVPAVISPYILQAIGQRQAGYLFMSAKPFSGQKALSLNLVHQLVDNPIHNNTDPVSTDAVSTEYGPTNNSCTNNSSTDNSSTENRHGYDALQAAALKQCKQLIRHGPQAMQACKQLIKTVAAVSDPAQVSQVTDSTVDLIAQLRCSAEGQEGLSAFLEKRHPNWITHE